MSPEVGMHRTHTLGTFGSAARQHKVSPISCMSYIGRARRPESLKEAPDPSHLLSTLLTAVWGRKYSFPQLQKTCAEEEEARNPTAGSRLCSVQY